MGFWTPQKWESMLLSGWEQQLLAVTTPTTTRESGGGLTRMRLSAGLTGRMVNPMTTTMRTVLLSGSTTTPSSHGLVITSGMIRVATMLPTIYARRSAKNRIITYLTNKTNSDSFTCNA